MQLNITESLACQVQLHLQVLPCAACSVTVVCGFLLMYNVGSPQGTHAFSTTPQGACIILSAAGSVACIVMCLGVPHMSRRLRLHVPEPVKRMSRLGLVSHDVHPKAFGQSTHLNLPVLHCFVSASCTLCLPDLACLLAHSSSQSPTEALACKQLLQDPAAGRPHTLECFFGVEL